MTNVPNRGTDSASFDRPVEVGRTLPYDSQTCRYPLVITLVAASLGICLAAQIGGPAPVWFLMAALLCLVRYGVARTRAVVAGQVLVLLAVMFLFGGRYQQRETRFLPDDIGHLATERPVPVAILGQLTSDPKPVYAQVAGDADASAGYQQGDQTRFDLCAAQIRDGSHWRSVSGQTRVVVDGHLLGVRAGDQVRILGQLRRPSEAMNPGQFSLAEYERMLGFLSRVVVKHPQGVTRVRASAWWNVRWWIPRLRGYLGRSLWSRIGPERYGLAAAILLGPRENLSDASVQAFFLTGTIHVLAISGLHVGLVAAGFLYAARLQWVPQHWAWYGVMAITIVYALIAEARAPVLRATVLIVILGLAHVRREFASPWNTLAAAAIVVLLWQPHELFQTGALLSFLAVAALASFVPTGLGRYPADPLERLLLKVRPRWQLALRAFGWKLVRMAIASFGVWCVVLPLVVHQFHIVTPVGLALNMLLFVPVGVTLFSGMGVLAFSWFLPPIASLCASICDSSLSLLEWGVRGCEQLPYGHVWWAGPPEWVVYAYYLGLALLIPCASMAWRWRGLLILTIVYVALSWLGWGREGGRGESLRGTFLSVGHGLCVVLEMPDGQLWLYDAGALGDPKFTCDTIAQFLWRQGRDRIDRVIVSHSDADHYNALPGLMQRFRVHELCITSHMARLRDSGVDQLLLCAAERNVKLVVLNDRHQFGIDGPYQVRVLHPNDDARYTNDNAGSAVLEVEAYGQRILLTGDLEADGMEEFRERHQCRVDVALAPHHGSRHSDPLNFAAWCNARWMIVSGSQSTLMPEIEQGSAPGATELLHTARDGAIFVTINQRGTHVSTWR